ncbi:MAG: hypothetical protein LBG80_09050 [Bacteroidales bacterium]|jgi:hypothetical protein|nr:hypothetical protein [Bacteroidales bacterium]
MENYGIVGAVKTHIKIIKTMNMLRFMKYSILTGTIFLQLYKKMFRVKTADFDHSNPVVENFLTESLM